MKRFLLNLPDELRETLWAASRARGQTLNGLIREILWAWVEMKQENK